MTRYEKYQLQWMIDHDYSLDDLIKSIFEYGVDCQGDYAMEPELFWQWEKILDLAVKSGLVTLNGWRMKAERNTK